MASDVIRDGNGRITGIRSKNIDLSVLDPRGTKGVKDVCPEFLLFPDSIQRVLQRMFQFRYFHDICEMLYAKGYQDRQSLFGVPYDFRMVLDPAYRIQLFHDMKLVIEEARQRNGSPVVVASHSLGGVLFKWFVSSHMVDQKWIDENIAECVMLSVPFGGSVLSLKTILTGDFYVPYFHKTIKPMVQLNSGIIMCFPNKLGFGDNDTIFEVESPIWRSISPNDYLTLADEGNVPFQIWRDLYLPNLPIITKKVSMTTRVFECRNKKTPNYYRVRNTDSYPHIEQYGRGDGVVNSIDVNTYYEMFDTHKLHVTYLDDIKHISVISHEKVLEHIDTVTDL
jgi:hypothetical protein